MNFPHTEEGNMAWVRDRFRKRFGDSEADAVERAAQLACEEEVGHEAVH